MDMNELITNSTYIVKRNLTEHVVFASILWDGNNRKFRLCYYVDVISSDQEREACNEAIGEIISGYPEIMYASEECFYIGFEKGEFRVKEPEIVVYSRDDPS